MFRPIRVYQVAADAAFTADQIRERPLCWCREWRRLPSIWDLGIVRLPMSIRTPSRGEFDVDHLTKGRFA